MMNNFGKSAEINNTENWPDIHDHPYKIVITGGSVSGKLMCY